MKFIDGQTVYQDVDFTEEFNAFIAEAKTRWRVAIEAWERQTGGQPFFGVHSGAGIKVYYLAPRHRVPKVRTILEPPLHGNNRCAWLDSVQAVVDFLRSKGIHCLIDYGIDD